MRPFYHIPVLQLTLPALRHLHILISYLVLAAGLRVTFRRYRQNMGKQEAHMVEMDKRVEVLLEAHKSGKLSRRDFIYRAGLIFGTVTIGGVILGNDLPPVHAQGNPTATLTGTAMPEGGETIALTTQMIEVETATTPVPAYHAYPEGGTNLPGVVVIQEWWGLDDHIKSVAELMARNGFAAIAPDLYRGEVATEPNEARKLAMELVMDQAIGDVQGAADFLVAQDYVEPKKVGVMGFCMGGRIAMQMSWEGTDSIGAVATFYGGGLNPTDDQFKAVKVPVLAYMARMMAVFQ